MGNQYLDIIYVIPVVIITAIICFAFHLGVEVGKDQQRRLQRARDRHPAGSDLTYSTGNVIPINRTIK